MCREKFSYLFLVLLLFFSSFSISAYADTATAIAAATNATKLSEFNAATTATLTNGEDTYIALVVYMPTDVGNEANYKTGTTAPQISLGIELIATQVENTTAFEDIVVD